MEWSFVFFLNSVLLGVGLAMDAFSVSMANGLHDPKMTKSTMVKIAGTFGIFQAAMPMIGWVCVHTIVELFSSFESLIPWIALALLGYMADHNRQHAQELHELAHSVDGEAAQLLHEAVVDLTVSSEKLAEALRILKGEE